MRPQPGKVNIHVSIMSLTTPKFIAERRMTAPTPIIALVFVCVVDTGMPKMLERSRHEAAARSAEKPWYFSSRTMSMPTERIIFSPPTLVPTPMTVLHSSMSHTGIAMPATLVSPPQKAMPRKRTPMNFCPS